MRIWALILLALVLAMAGKAQGQATWVGTTNANWATGTDWTGGTGVSGAPASGQGLKFGAAGTGGATLTDNLTTGTGSWTVAGITFKSGAAAFVINPFSNSNGFQLTTGITNNSTSLETINDNIATTTSGSDTFTMTAGGGNITLGGNVIGGDFVTAGTGTLTLGGADAFTNSNIR
ncbi:MAG: hypothetical protein ABSE62_16890 [Chthoniobacteraceae bacterium]